MGSHRVDLIPPALNCHMLSIREFITDLVPKVYIGGFQISTFYLVCMKV